MTQLGWWPFYGRDFFGDERVKLMSNAQIGMYTKLLDHQWNEGSIPTTIGYSAFMDLRNVLHDPVLAEKEFSEVMSHCFVPHPKLELRVYNVKMDKVRRAQAKLQKENQRHGRRGGIATQAKRRLKHSLDRSLEHSVDSRLSEIQANQNQNQNLKKEKKKKENTFCPVDLNQAGPSVLNGRAYRAEAKEVLTFLNEKTSKHFREVEVNLFVIEARLKSGVDVQTCKTLIVRKVRDWGPDPKMAKFLRPETLFNRTKFETYLAEVTS